MSSLSLVKTQLHNSIADSVYKEVSSRTGRYYYFLGKAVEWSDESNPPLPIDSFTYEKDVRKNIILVKEITPSDVAYVVERIDWVSGTVYDMYDDHYSTEVAGLNLLAGGSNYSSNVTITISGGSGTGATANAIVTSGAITSVNLLTKGSSFVNKPNVIISDAYGSGANVQAVLGYAYSGASTLQEANFYVVTDQFNIYKCLDNNNNAQSTVKPVELSAEAFTTSDGYKWKFMGNVPIALRNKFLSPTFMPVTTAVSSNFYSKGEIKSVNILDTGSGYTTANIIVQGDGYLESEPYLVTNFQVAKQGNTYTSANIIIDPPVTATTSWRANTYYSVGKILSFLDNYYEVVLAGTTRAVGSPWAANTSYNLLDIVYNTDGSNVEHFYLIANSGASNSTGPTFIGGSQTLGNVTYEYIGERHKLYGPQHTIGTQQNGSAGFKFRGTGITANAVISGGGITGLANLKASIRDVVITNVGSGYNSPPTVTFNGGGGSNASAYANFLDNAVKKVYITDSGRNYTSAPTVTFGEGWQANTFFEINEQVFYLTNLYTVTSNGYSNVTSPTHTSGSRTLGNAIFAYSGSKATGYARLKYGAGYIGQPRANVQGNGDGTAQVIVQVEKTEALIDAYVEQGRVSRVVIQDGGVGYTYGTITVVGNGSNASLQLNLSQGDLESFQSLSELQAVSGAIHTIQVVSQGYGYNSFDCNVTVSGDGTGATANATVIAGRVSKINMVSEGSGYTYATVSISGGTGKGATARAILPPYNGHGRDTINELYARNLSFYSIINQEANQGFIVTNDYRQFGIIKDIRNLNNSKYFNNGTGSGCYLISGTVNSSVFTEDVIVRRALDNTAFLIISSSNNAILVSSLDETVPVIGDTISTAGGNTFIVTGVTNPDVDKYSGELIYIDNRRAFSTTEDQSVSLNTVIRF
jgi:hypothetical protein